MNTKKRIAIALAVLMVVAMAVPATADYVAENTKMNIYKQGAGDLVYTYGTPFYTCINTGESATYNIDLGVLHKKDVVDARLYVYWTWSLYDVEGTSSSGDDVATYPVLDVEVNQVPVSFDYAPGTNWIDHYTDAKNIAAVGEHKYLPNGTKNPNYVSWNFLSGTNCSGISVKAHKLTPQQNNIVTVTNVHPYTGGYYNGAKVCIQGVGILLTLEDDNKMYWIAEGNDVTYVYWSTKSNKWSYGITPDNATTKVTFPGAIPSGMDTATLTSVIPAGDLGYNSLYFNGPYNWDGLWNSVPDKNLAVSVTDVSAALRSHNNMARFQNGLENPNNGDKQMNVANAFLVVE